MKTFGSEDGDIGFQLGPMVGVIFASIFLFVLCTAQQTKERELAFNAPLLRDGSHNPVVIDISAAGQIIANYQTFGTPTDKELSSFRSWFKTAGAQSFDDPVVIRPEPGTRVQRIIDVLNACSATGIKGLTFSFDEF